MEKKIIYKTIFLVSVLLILGRFIFAGKYILFLDLIVTPSKIFIPNLFDMEIFINNNIFSYLPLVPIITFANTIIPMWIIEKIILVLIFTMAIFFAYEFIDMNSFYSNIYCGILYMINPYTYIRIVSGQWTILLSYAALPLLLKIFIDLLEKRQNKEIIKFIIVLSIVAFNIHMFIISIILMIIIFIFWLHKYKNIRILKVLAFSIIIFILLNSYWLIPVLTTRNSIIDTITNEDIEVFSPNIENNIYGWFEIAAMYGFWKGGYIYAKDFIPGWQILYLIIFSLAIIGFLAYYKDKKIGYIVNAMAVIWIVGFILASGIKGPFGDQVYWLFNNTILKGFRDSHKFVAMMALSYAILGGLGISRFEGMSEKKKYLKAIIGIALIVPFIYSFTFFNGFAGQIKPTDYPADWYEVNDLLNQDGQDFKVLFFPWHGYINFKWVNNTQKTIADPSKYFFDKEVIGSLNLEVGNISRQDNAPDQLYIASLLKNRSHIKNFGKRVSILNVKYVILAKAWGSTKYDFLFHQNDMELVSETDTLYVFKNKNKVAKIYQTDDIENIGDKEEVKYETVNPVKFEVTGSDKKYLVFTEPYSNDWKLDRKEPVKAYGVVNAFENGGKEIRFERFYRVNLPAYVISILTFVGLISMYVRKAFK